MFFFLFGCSVANPPANVELSRLPNSSSSYTVSWNHGFDVENFLVRWTHCPEILPSLVETSINFGTPYCENRDTGWEIRTDATSVTCLCCAVRLPPSYSAGSNADLPEDSDEQDVQTKWCNDSAPHCSDRSSCDIEGFEADMFYMLEVRNSKLVTSYVCCL